MSNRVIVKPHGPLVIYGDIRLESADGALIQADTNLYLCRCGHSRNKPFCDGEHKRHGFSDPAEIHDDKPEELSGQAGLVISVRPNAMLVAKGPMQIESEDGRYRTTRNKAALCRCGHSENKPFCDISHKRCGFTAD